MVEDKSNSRNKNPTFNALKTAPKVGHKVIPCDKESYFRLTTAFSGSSCDEPPTRIV